VFLGRNAETPRHPHDGPVLLMAGPVLLAVLGLVFALMPAVLHHFISSPMASAVIGAEVHVAISAVPHAGLPFLLSLVTIALGAAILFWLEPVRDIAARLLAIIGWGPDRGFDQIVAATVRGSWRLTRLLQP